MKQIRNYILPLMAVPLILSSCVKDHLALDPAQSNNVVEFANTGNNLSPATALYPRYGSDLGSLETGKSATFNVNVSYSGAETAPADITVNLVVDQAALDAYNAEQGTHYVVPPASVATIPSSVIIKKGTQVFQLKVAVTNNNDFDFNVNYALPLKIASTSAGVVSGNYGLSIYTFAVRNVFDGKYEMTGTMVDQTSATLTGYYPINVELITYSGNSIAMYDPVVAKTYAHAIKSGTANSSYGSFSPIFAFDAGGNVTVSNYYGADAGANKRNAALDATGINKITYGADGHVAYFEVSYIMTQSNAPRTYFKEKFTYVGPR